MHALPLTPHTWRGSWNYTIGAVGTVVKDTHEDLSGRQDESLAGADRSDPDSRSRPGVAVQSDPRLTGTSHHALHELAADLGPGAGRSNRATLL